ncbi:hypothetical protein DASC09_062670 [Saccharomycopsis crataegensis]|uniref:Uncharacterized protein n=1 Tax=Saccharomycopsis crataegensis TaxID=43959 RepID=A0AAV5QVG2_9ASCO|nr:hypothetical protein DASC09_062670 [Saccharomycopsis crataegensis]
MEKEKSGVNKTTPPSAAPQTAAPPLSRAAIFWFDTILNIRLVIDWLDLDRPTDIVQSKNSTSLLSSRSTSTQMSTKTNVKSPWNN